MVAFCAIVALWWSIICYALGKAHGRAEVGREFGRAIVNASCRPHSDDMGI